MIGADRNSLVGDSAASLVAHAPESAWRRGGFWSPYSGSFNHVSGFGGIGNTDVAIEMRGIANFTLKGIRTDASKITDSSFAGLRLLATALAESQGIPIKLGPNDVACNQTSGTTPAVDPQQQQLDSETKLRRQRAAAMSILQAIARESDAIATDPQGVATRISSSFKANQGDLSLQ